MKSIRLVVQRCFPLPHLSFIHTLSIQTLTSLPPSLEMKSNLISHAILLKQIIMYPTATISCPRRMNRAFSNEMFTQSPQSFSRLAFHFLLRHSFSKSNSISLLLRSSRQTPYFQRLKLL